MADLRRDLDDELSASLRKIFDAVALIDATRALGRLGGEPGWCWPALGRDLDLEAFAHPTLTGDMVTNDLRLDAGACLVLTGPNAGGKSSVARAVALASIYAQAGAPVFAKRAALPLRDAVFTRMGAADALAAGRSTFLHELERAAVALEHATDKSLVVLDELGRGTATHDGVAVAGAALDALVARGCATIFVTHYHDLAASARAARPARSRRTAWPTPPWAAGRSTSTRSSSCSTSSSRASRTVLRPPRGQGGGAARRGPAARPGEAGGAAKLRVCRLCGAFLVGSVIRRLFVDKGAGRVPHGPLGPGPPRWERTGLIHVGRVRAWSAVFADLVNLLSNWLILAALGRGTQHRDALSSLDALGLRERLVAFLLRLSFQRNGHPQGILYRVARAARSLNSEYRPKHRRSDR